MDKQQFIAARDALTLDNEEISHLLGLTSRAVRRYVDGTRKVPAPVERFLQLILALRLSPVEVTSLLKGKAR